MLLRKESAALLSCGFALLSCAPATRAALVPQLDVGLRSSRVSSAALRLAAPRESARRWDVTLFARLSWRSRGAPELYPSVMTLDPNRWDAVCVDELNCLWDDLDEARLRTWLEAEP